MKQVVIIGHGGPEKLQVREAPDPEPKRERCGSASRRAASTSPTSWRAKVCIPIAPELPAVVGYEVSGVGGRGGGGVDHALIGTDVVL